MGEVICGIDLGTTNSVIARLDNGKPEALRIEEGVAIVPSVVSLDEVTGQLLVGRSARNRLAAFSDCTVRSVKRLMGQDTVIRLGSRKFTPEEVSSHILRYLIHNASEAVGQQIQKAVITVPAYFDDAQRRATIRAGELAGIEVLRIINEPTAAALVYDRVSWEDTDDSPYIMVYDLGGGTFDVSILELKGEIKEVLASCGNSALGGDDFDERLKDFFLRHLKEKTGYELAEDRTLNVRLRDIAERTKIALSDRPYVLVDEVAVAVIEGEPINLSLEVSRIEFEDMTRDLLESTLEKVREALQEAGLGPEDMGRIILVGGATRMPEVQARLSDMFDRPIEHSLDPDLCVALGASVQAGLIAGEPLGHILLDVTAHSLGVKTLDPYDLTNRIPDYFSVIIRRNTRIPVSRAELYYTVQDRQSGVDVQVHQGESPACSENTLIGEFYFPLKPAPAHSPVTVEFAYDLEGIVHVSVDQKGFNNSKSVTLNVRQKALQEAGETEGLADKPVNYIAEKARRILADERLPQELKEVLTKITGKYERAVRAEEDDALIDELEDQLLEKIEEAEEGLETIG